MSKRFKFKDDPNSPIVVDPKSATKAVRPQSHSQLSKHRVFNELGKAYLDNPLISNMTIRRSVAKTKRAFDEEEFTTTFEFESSLIIRVHLDTKLLEEIDPDLRSVVEFKVIVPNRWSSNYKLDVFLRRVAQSSSYSITEGSVTAKKLFNLGLKGKVNYLLKRLQPTRYIELLSGYYDGLFHYAVLSSDPRIDTDDNLIDDLHRGVAIEIDKPGSGKSPIDDDIVNFLLRDLPEYNPVQNDPSYNTDDSVEYDHSIDRVLESHAGRHKFSRTSRTHNIVSSLTESGLDPEEDVSDDISSLEEDYVRAVARGIDDFSVELNKLLDVYDTYSFDYTEYSDFGPETVIEDLVDVHEVEIEVFSPSDDPLVKVRLVVDEESGELTYVLRRGEMAAKQYSSLYYIIRELGVVIREDSELTEDLQDNFDIEEVRPYNELDYEPLEEELEEIDSLDDDPIDEDELFSEDEEFDDLYSPSPDDSRVDTPLDLRMKERIERRRSER